MDDHEKRESRVKVLVIGVGNEYRRDDGAGPFVARMLKRKNLREIRVEYECGEATALMESWRRANTVILLDAVRPGTSPGRVYRVNASNQPLPACFCGSSTHELGVAEAVELARALECLPSRLLVYGIEGKDFAQGKGLSLEVEMAAGKVIEMVMADMCSGLRGPASETASKGSTSGLFCISLPETDLGP
jgi:hydrogenase maturation protease